MSTPSSPRETPSGPHRGRRGRRTATPARALSIGGEAWSVSPTDTVVAPRRSSRAGWVDNLRVALTVLVLAHHSAVSHGSFDLWPYWTPPLDRTSEWLDVLVMANQTFFMGLFFLLSGWSVPRAFDRAGFRGFLRQRFLRLGAPWLFYMVLLRPFVLLHVWRTTVPPAEQTPASFGWWYLTHLDPGPLWFIGTLLVLNVAYALWRRAVPSFPGFLPTRLGPLTLIVFALALGGVTAAWRLAFPIGTHWPIIGIPSVEYVPQYVILFAVGIAAQRRGWFETIGVATAVGAGVVMLATFAVNVVFHFEARSDWVAALSDQVCAVAACVVWLVVFRSFFTSTVGVWQAGSRGAFAVYVVHTPILVWVAVAMGLVWQASPVLMAAALFAVSIPLCWGAAAVLVRIPRVRAMF